MSDAERERFEFYESQSNRHSIESHIMLTEEETGRVVAVFYNDYDCQNVIELQDENESIKVENDRLKAENESTNQENDLMYRKNEKFDLLVDELKAEIEKLKRID
mgnify:CR=1 FL=1